MDWRGLAKIQGMVRQVVVGMKTGRLANQLVKTVK
jgi:hypothetical protein